ncbi:MAG: SMC-Scp complex subunit ScpB, partial [Gammaproteobacteria bacterium]
MELYTVKNILEAILLSVDKPMDLRQLDKLFEVDDENRPSKEQIMEALQVLQEDYQGRGMELTEVSSGYRIQVREDYTGWISRLWEEKAPRYSRALLETLVLIAYRQPITRGEIEEIRGVSVSSHIMKTLQEREWVRVLGHKDVPGKPSMYGTTSDFLDYFNLKSLDELPPLSDIQDLDKLHPSLQLDDEQASTEAETAESQIPTAVTAEVDSDSENTNEPLDAPNDAYEAGVEEVDEDLDQKLEQEKLIVSRESSENTDPEEPSDAVDLDESSEAIEDSVALDRHPLEDLAEPDDSSASEARENPGSETITEALESEPDDSEPALDDPTISDETDVEDIVDDEAAEQDPPLMFEQPSDDADLDEASELIEDSAELDRHPLEDLAEPDDSSASEAPENPGSETITEALESEPDDSGPALDDPTISDETDVEDIVDDDDAAVEQDPPQMFEEPSDAVDLDEDEASEAIEDSVELDRQPLEDLAEPDDLSASEALESEPDD